MGGGGGSGGAVWVHLNPFLVHLERNMGIDYIYNIICHENPL